MSKRHSGITQIIEKDNALLAMRKYADQFRGLKWIVIADQKPLDYERVLYTRENHGKWPSYILLHPETRHKILISERDAEQGMQFRVVNHSIKSIHEGLTTTTQVFGMSLIQTYDVEPGFIIICG